MCACIYEYYIAATFYLPLLVSWGGGVVWRDTGPTSRLFGPAAPADFRQIWGEWVPIFRDRVRVRIGARKMALLGTEVACPFGYATERTRFRPFGRFCLALLPPFCRNSTQILLESVRNDRWEVVVGGS